MPYIPQPRIHMNMHQVSTIYHPQPESAPFDQLGQVAVIEQRIAQFWTAISAKGIVDGTAYQYILSIRQRYGAERIIDLPGGILHGDTNVAEWHADVFPETRQFLLCAEREHIDMLSGCLGHRETQGIGSMPRIRIGKEQPFST